MTFFSLKTDVNGPIERNKQKNLQKTYFYWHLESHRRKEFFFKIFLLITSVGTFTSVFNDKKHGPINYIYTKAKSRQQSWV